jgi:transcriptional regulator with XRE-family HTH domain
LRGSLGWLLYGERAARGWSQEVLAARAKVGFTTVRDLERGVVRPSDRMCRRLAEGLAFDRDPLAVAVLDLRFQRAAGPSLRRWRRRRPPRVAVQRLYTEAMAVINAEDATRQAEQDATAAAFIEEFTTQWRADAASAQPPSTPAQAWPGRWPRVRG